MQISEFVKNVVFKNNFNRERFVESNLPTEPSQLTIFPFFGDYRGMMLLSSMLLKRYKEEIKSSKYFILLSYPGCASLFPYVDEYWSINDNFQCKKLFEQAINLNTSFEYYTMCLRTLNEYFRDVNDYRVLSYENGITQGFLEKYKHIKRYYPSIPSISILNKDMQRDLNVKSGYKIFIHPTRNLKYWSNGQTKNFPVKPDYWVGMINSLIKNNYCPIVWNNYATHDLTQELEGKNCILFNETDMSKVLATMRFSHCVLDVFNSLSRLAIIARSPFICLDERSRFFGEKEYEINDLFAFDIPKEYIFSFSTIIREDDIGGYGKANHLFHQNIVLKKLETFLPTIQRELLPTTGEINELVKYENVRKIRTKKFNPQFIKINR
jgi:hypothetical protein